MFLSLFRIALVFATFSLCVSTAFPYTGFRVTLQKPVFADLYTDILKATVNSTLIAPWPSIIYRIGSEPFNIGFDLTSITCTEATFNESKIELTIEQNLANYKLIGTPISYTFTFEYDFQMFGMHFFFGTGQAQIILNSLELTQTFSEQSVNTNTTFSAGTSISHISGTDPFKGITLWCLYLLHAFHEQNISKILSKFLSLGTAKILQRYFEVKVPVYLNGNGSLNLTLESSLFTLNEVPHDYVSLSFFTNITVEKRPYNKKLYRFHQSSVVPEGAKGQVCVAANIIPGMLEVLGKTREFVFPIEPVRIGLSGKMLDLVNLMPELNDQYNTDEDIYIGCRAVPDSDILMINDPWLTANEIRIQIPVNCIFGPKKSNINLFSVTFSMRASIYKEIEVRKLTYWIKGTVKRPELYYYELDYSFGKIEQTDTLIKILRKIVGLMEGFKVIPEGLGIPVPFDPTGGSYKMDKEEYCFNYY
eukprot:TRINITY_DN108220_c0_g1_i1.p1 TRINITY_DN108220_c0_g1~~TRINITY_DN108220_c0_g1_i1.p1  ORF type:complete len:502 (+),score=23.92 TRINITY_DN108220_c0_g1_i1:80-1507(+)